MKHNDAFVLREICGRHILMPIRANSASDDPIVFSDVAIDIWLAAADEASISDLTARIADEYGLESDSPELLAVTAFAEQLYAMGLIYEDAEEGL